MKINLKEIFVILGISIFLAFFYNAVRDDPVSLIPKSKEELQVSDSILFGNFSYKNQNNINNINRNLDTSASKNSGKLNILDTINNKLDSNHFQSDTENKDAQVNIKPLLKESKKGEHTKYLNVTYEQVLKIITSNDFVLIDARRPEQFAKSHIPKAINLFPGEEEEILIGKILSLQQDKTYIIYCDGGNCDLSAELAALLENFGYKRFFLYEGGWDEWSKMQNKKASL